MALAGDFVLTRVTGATPAAGAARPRAVLQPQRPEKPAAGSGRRPRTHDRAAAQRPSIDHVDVASGTALDEDGRASLGARTCAAGYGPNGPGRTGSGAPGLDARTGAAIPARALHLSPCAHRNRALGPVVRRAYPVAARYGRGPMRARPTPCRAWRRTCGAFGRARSGSALHDLRRGAAQRRSLADVPRAIAHPDRGRRLVPQTASRAAICHPRPRVDACAPTPPRERTADPAGCGHPRSKPHQRRLPAGRRAAAGPGPVRTLSPARSHAPRR